jgi:hypothetical protein
MRHTIGVVNGRINSSRSGGDDEETCTLEKPYSYTRRRHIFVDVMQFYAWTLLPELSKTNNDHHQVIFTRTTLIRIRAKEDQLLSLLSHIFRINLTRFIQIKIEIFFLRRRSREKEMLHYSFEIFVHEHLLNISETFVIEKLIMFCLHFITYLYIRSKGNGRERERERRGKKSSD